MTILQKQKKIERNRFSPDLIAKASDFLTTVCSIQTQKQEKKCFFETHFRMNHDQVKAEIKAKRFQNPNQIRSNDIIE